MPWFRTGSSGARATTSSVPAGSLLIHRAGYEVRPAGGGGGGGGRGRGGAAGTNAPARTGRGGRAECPGPAAADPAAACALARGRWIRQQQLDGRARPEFLRLHEVADKPVSDLEIGFYASLPCLLAVKAVREGRSFRWDDAAKKAVAV